MTTISAMASGTVSVPPTVSAVVTPASRISASWLARLNNSWPGNLHGQQPHGRAVLRGQRVADQTAGRLDASRSAQRLLGSGEFDDALGQRGVGLTGGGVGAAR